MPLNHIKIAKTSSGRQFKAPLLATMENYRFVECGTFKICGRRFWPWMIRFSWIFLFHAGSKIFFSLMMAQDVRNRKDFVIYVHFPSCANVFERCLQEDEKGKLENFKFIQIDGNFSFIFNARRKNMFAGQKHQLTFGGLFKLRCCLINFCFAWQRTFSENPETESFSMSKKCKIRTSLKSSVQSEILLKKFMFKWFCRIFYAFLFVPSGKSSERIKFMCTQ